MQFITSVFSLVNNVSEVDRQFKDLYIKLTYKIKLTEDYMSNLSELSYPHFIFENVRLRVKQAHEYELNIKNLLEADSLSLQNIYQQSKNKIRLSLPFNKTNQRVKGVLEQLDKALEDLKEYNKTKEEDQPYNGKKKSHTDITSTLLRNNIEKTKPTTQQIDQGINEMYQLMGPTIEQNNALELQRNKKVELFLAIKGNQKLTQFLKNNPQLAQQQKSYKIQSDIAEEIELLNIGRMYFKSHYKVIKELFPDVDRISKLNHFRVLWRPYKQQLFVNKGQDKAQTLILETNDTKNINSLENTIKNDNSIPVVLSQQKSNFAGDVFFSFPQPAHEIMHNGSLWIIKPKEKVLYRLQKQQWCKVEQQQFEICNGEQVATSLNPKTKQPELYFKLTYDLPQ